MAISYGIIIGACAVLCTALPTEKLPILKDAPSEVLFTSDNPFVLECKLVGENSNGVTFSWIKDGSPLTINSKEITQRQGEGSLVFQKPSDKVSGTYRCLATSEAGQASTRPINVRKAYINPPKTTLQKLKPTDGKPFQMDCAIPDAYPKPKISWHYQLISDSGVSNEVMDPRMTIAPEGTLYVTSAAKSDANKNFKYVCVANTPAAKSGVPLAEYVIEDVLANSNPDNEVYELYTSKDMTVKAGEMTYLYCIFGGTPLAHPDWFKDGVDVNGSPNDRVTRYNRSKGKRLLIRDVWLTDAGSYRCVADNEKGKPKEHTMKLSVVAAPKADAMPSAVTRGKSGREITIPCHVAGVPSPRLYWTYNAQPLKVSDKITINEVTKGNLTVADLTIRGAQTTDKGYYGCHAENEYGELYSETLLVVA
ncbi:hemolin-like [Zerene cesonia]|uniref:hemolin-like n=1 Tax=Zerene cesonia TaxID=33412 RepID=UPI0018E583E4|nr:hemolin-like [Zerene cesonia]